MIIIIKQIYVYTWDELTEEAREKAIERRREENYDYEPDYDLDYHTEWLDARGFERADISWSGFYSQGDGASFTADVSLEKIFSYMVYQSTSWDDIKIFYYFLELLKRDLIEFPAWSTRRSCSYSHENTCRIDYDFNLNMENYSGQAEDWFIEAAGDIISDIEDLRHEWSQTIYQALQGEYEYTQTDEYLIDELSDSQFTEDGSIYYE